NNWSDAANWSGDSVPTTGDSAIFDGTSIKDCLIDASGPQGANININGININSGYTGTVTVGSGVNTTFTSSSSQSSGTFTCGGGLVKFETTTFILNGGSFN